MALHSFSSHQNTSAFFMKKNFDMPCLSSEPISELCDSVTQFFSCKINLRKSHACNKTLEVFATVETTPVTGDVVLFPPLRHGAAKYPVPLKSSAEAVRHQITIRTFGYWVSDFD